MPYSKQLVSLLCVVLFATPLHAADSKPLDDTVAAGIVFKIGYLLGMEGSWSRVDTHTPESFKDAMSLISKDLSQFSDTERGILLKKEGEQLISFLTKCVTLGVTAQGDAKPNGESEAFYRKLDLDPNNPDPTKLAQILTTRLAAYANLSATPAWVYDPTKREQVGAANRDNAGCCPQDH
ncbi:hypothetical protein [Sulfuriroseicoccus oceanibius]|uniref:Uncharacterized protein n=1 Tax=Sulfuriroseicoccus oceanibius TaxID=2707525 RepID=A0A6B3LEH6_9BACT|nr:hypothetical protein [Sulfuriroseicoccus oceanibius]QQL44078.1 hypothetical protein G3M56_009245 [Sulfuriroseicoccus oceanibius]